MHVKDLSLVFQPIIPLSRGAYYRQALTQEKTTLESFYTQQELKIFQKIINQVAIAVETCKNQSEENKEDSRKSIFREILESPVGNDIIPIILSHISYYKRFSLRTVSKQFNQIIDNLPILENYLICKRLNIAIKTCYYQNMKPKFLSYKEARSLLANTNDKQRQIIINGFQHYTITKLKNKLENPGYFRLSYKNLAGLAFACFLLMIVLSPVYKYGLNTTTLLGTVFFLCWSARAFYKFRYNREFLLDTYYAHQSHSATPKAIHFFSQLNNANKPSLEKKETVTVSKYNFFKEKYETEFNRTLTIIKNCESSDTKLIWKREQPNQNSNRQ